MCPYIVACSWPACSLTPLPQIIFVGKWDLGMHWHYPILFDGAQNGCRAMLH